MSLGAQPAVRDAWDAIASRFDAFGTPLTMIAGQALVDRLGINPATRFLDVGTGSGALAIPAARRGARVMAVDIAPGMIERLRARAGDEGLTRLEARVMDGCALELDDATFDVVASLNGVSLFPQLEQGVAEMARVARPGGRVQLTGFGPPARVEWLGFFLAALQATVSGFAGPSMDPPPLPFQVADPARLGAVLAGAGLREVVVDEVVWPTRFDSGRHLWDVVTSSNPIGAALVAGVTDREAEAVCEVLDGMLRDRSSGSQGATLHTELNVGLGRA